MYLIEKSEGEVLRPGVLTGAESQGEVTGVRMQL